MVRGWPFVTRCRSGYAGLLGCWQISARSTADLNRTGAALPDRCDLASAVRSGQADCGIATRAAARTAGLEFLPLLWENFDLLMRQRTYFQPSFQALLGFLPQKAFTDRAVELTGYDTSPAGRIRFFR